MGADIKEIGVSKVVEEFEGMDDVLASPRSWSPKALKEVCQNTEIKPMNALAQEMNDFEEAVINFLIRDFFFLSHQNGLYNPQKQLWTTIAKTKKISIVPVKKFLWGGGSKHQMSDIILSDSSMSRFIKARLVHPNDSQEEEAPGFSDILKNIPKECKGIFYFFANPLPDKVIDKIKSKTNSQDAFDRYKSPVTDECSLNMIRYFELENKSGYEFVLAHPNLERKVGSKIVFNS